MARPSSFDEPKQPWEEWPVDVSFELDAGEAVVSRTVTALDLATGSDATAEVIDELNISEAAGVVTVPVKGGTDGHTYKITVRVVTDSAPPRRLEKDLRMPVREY